MQHIITPGMMYIHAGVFYLTYICTTYMIIVIGNIKNMNFACMTYSVRFPNCDYLIHTSRRRAHFNADQDSGSKLIFGNAELCSQFLRNYMNMPVLKNVRPEDIEDVTERYLPMFTEERNSDTVKRIKIEEIILCFLFPLLNIKQKWIIM